MKKINYKKSWKVFFAVVLIGLVFAGCIVNSPAKADTASEINDKLDSLTKKLKDATALLATQQSQLYKNTSQINATQAIIKKIQGDMSQKEAELQNLNQRAQLNRDMLVGYMRQLYYSDQEQDPLTNLISSQGDLSDIFMNFDGMVGIKGKILDSLQVINDAKTKAELAKADLADQKVDTQQDLKVQQVQQNAIASDIQDTQATLAELQKKFAKLQSDLNELMGTSYNAKDIKDAVGFASDKTGVPKGVLYGFLTQESGRGKNVGQCSYADVEKVSIAGYKKYGKKYQNSIDTLYYREKLFNNLLDDLGYKSKKVSCTIPFSSAGPNQGGAMGAAQFMADTWGGADGKHGYVPQISSMTGHSRPDPWNITDAVMAMAIKVRSAGGTSDSNSAIKKSVINYYGAFSQGYYNTVVYWAKNYKQLL